MNKEKLNELLTLSSIFGSIAPLYTILEEVPDDELPEELRIKFETLSSVTETFLESFDTYLKDMVKSMTTEDSDIVDKEQE